jgi:HEPN domain-containing protein
MQEHEKWLKIANEDLLAAKTLLTVDLFSTVVYHAQQTAEKSLKAYLIFKKHPVVKTHDLIQLLELCMRFDSNFKNLYEAVRLLNPFSTQFRYPSEFDIPDTAKAKIAIKYAQNIMNFVVKSFAAPETGQVDIFKGHNE